METELITGELSEQLFKQHGSELIEPSGSESPMPLCMKSRTRGLECSGTRDITCRQVLRRETRYE